MRLCVCFVCMFACLMTVAVCVCPLPPSLLFPITTYICMYVHKYNANQKEKLKKIHYILQENGNGWMKEPEARRKHYSTPPYTTTARTTTTKRRKRQDQQNSVDIGKFSKAQKLFTNYFCGRSKFQSRVYYLSSYPILPLLCTLYWIFALLWRWWWIMVSFLHIRIGVYAESVYNICTTIFRFSISTSLAFLLGHYFTTTRFLSACCCWWLFVAFSFFPATMPFSAKAPANQPTSHYTASQRDNNNLGVTSKPTTKCV